MRQPPRWQRDESRHPGVDFADPGEVAAHQRMALRNEGELEARAERLGLGPGQVLIDVGAGAGAFAVCAARRCEKVYAVDVSAEMLRLARRRATEAGVENIEFACAGFLTYQHAGPPADVVTSHVALHHLPDAWKLIGLTRVAAMLRPGGRLHLMDVVYSFDPQDYAMAFDAFVAAAVEHFGPDVQPRAEATVRDEFPTWDWILEGMLRQAGFHIDLANYRGGLAEYLCTKSPANATDTGGGP